MIPVDKAIRINYKSQGIMFQALAGFDELEVFKKKPSQEELNSVLAEFKVFKDAQKGELASEKDIQKVFGELSEEEILMKILLEGEPQIPAAHLAKLKEQKKQQVLNYLKENAVNPTTKGPYTETILANEMQKLKYNFDPHKDFIKQAEDVLNQLRKLIPISVDVITLEIEVPMHFIGKVQHLIRSTTLEKESYEGAQYTATVSMTAGKKDAFINQLRNATNNEAGFHLK